MKKSFLIKNPELFQGEKYLKTNKNYFEGWYFKNINNKYGISFIPGISINKQERKAFIQVITNDSSYYVNYDIEQFNYSHFPFYIKIGNNFFSKDKIHIDIKDKSQKIKIHGDINYSDSQNINTGLLNPNIMGPFSYISFMECNHAILSMKNKAQGYIYINGNKLNFTDGIGYIEKDWGYSFPNSYLWCQGNNFQKSTASFMLSIADIPFKIFHFKGIICALMVNDEEYNFTTYNNTKLIKYEIEDNLLNIVLKKDNYCLHIKSQYNSGFKLAAPVKGKMEKDILESISESISVILKKDNNIIFSDTSTNCGLEIVKE